MKQLFLVLFLLIHQVAFGKESFSGEFLLKGGDPSVEPMLAREYRLIVQGGVATLKATKDGKSVEDKGTVSVTVLNGVDPKTRKHASFSGFMRVEVTKSGWAADQFVLRFDIPFVDPSKRSEPGKEIANLSFAKKAAVQVLWREVMENGVTRFLDPMGIRTEAEYSVEVIKNPMKGLVTDEEGQ